MKNLFIYYLFILIPLVALVVALYYNKDVVFVAGILVYALIYRPITDGFRLLEIGRINKNEFAKLFIPFWSIKWFKSLYFQN